MPAQDCAPKILKRSAKFVVLFRKVFQTNAAEKPAKKMEEKTREIITNKISCCKSNSILSLGHKKLQLCICLALSICARKFRFRGVGRGVPEVPGAQSFGFQRHLLVPLLTTSPRPWRLPLETTPVT